MPGSADSTSVGDMKGRHGGSDHSQPSACISATVFNFRVSSKKQELQRIGRPGRETIRKFRHCQGEDPLWITTSHSVTVDSDGV